MATQDDITYSEPELTSWHDGNSAVEGFARLFSERTGKTYESYYAFESDTIAEFRLFWRTFLDSSGLKWKGDSSEVCIGDDIEHAVFFPQVRLNYAANLLTESFPDEELAITAIGHDHVAQQMSRAELRKRVEHLAGGLRSAGLVPGDRVAAIARNGAEVIIAALAVTALGGIFASAAPEAGADAIIDRFGQIEPAFLLANIAPYPHDSGAPVSERVALVLKSLPTVRAFVGLDGAASDLDVAIQRYDLPQLMAQAPIAMADWPQFSFNHPLFILFSSGTTGRPKCMVHGAGGSLLEHVKEHRFHCDLRPSDVFYFHVSCAWMVWNWQLSALASGASIVAFSGAIDTPERLWTIAADHDVAIMGTSPSYLRLCEDTGIRPIETHNLQHLRSIISSGSILFDDQFVWFRDNVKDVPVQTVSGGTDIMGCFVTASPLLDIHDGEGQGRSLGMDVRALGANAPDEIGELVCANPFPSRPLCFYGDVDGSRFHQSYFAANKGYWTHGDLISVSIHHGIRMHGRSDGLLNIRGIRVGPAEIYNVVRDFPEVKDVMAVEQNLSDAHGDTKLILLIVPAAGCSIDPTLAMDIRRRLSDTCSSAHVPNMILSVAALPMTFSGKQSEAAMSDAINGRPVRNISAIANPQMLDHITAMIADLAANDAGMLETIDPTDEARIANYLTGRWSELLNFSPIGLDDNFFDLGGSSLSAARLFADVHQVTGRLFPLNTLLKAPTIRELTKLFRMAEHTAGQPITLLRSGSAGRPFFMIHSFAANVLELWPLRSRLTFDRDVYAIECEGLNGGSVPQSVEEMAASYIRLIRATQPRGPYNLGGYSYGGTIAFEIARQLDLAGDEIENLIMLDSGFDPRFLPISKRVPQGFRRTARIIRSTFSRPATEAFAEFKRGAMVRLDRAARAVKIRSQEQQYLEEHLADLSPQLSRVREAIRLASTRYNPPPFACNIHYLRTAEASDFDAVDGWQILTGSKLTVHPVPGDHYSMLSNPDYANITAMHLNRLLATAS